MTGLVEHGIEGSNGKISRMFMLDRLERHARGALVIFLFFKSRRLAACKFELSHAHWSKTISWIRNIVSASAAAPRWHTRVRMELSCQGYSEKRGLRQLAQLRQMRDSSA